VTASAVAVPTPPDASTAHGAPGTLVVIEGIDRSGRSTHAALVEARLREQGHSVARTGLGSASVASPALQAARRDGGRDPVAMTLLYAADLAERAERVVVPALRAGQVVLADRYIWTPMARAAARGIDLDWLATVFAFAPKPDLVLWLDVTVSTSLRRRDRDPDPFEAGLDQGLSPDVRKSYELFQQRLSDVFRRFATTGTFTRIAADGPPEEVQPAVDDAIDGLLARRRPA
jgi:dTMP kinase